MKDVPIIGRQRGITAIEAVGALAIGALMLIGLAQMIDTSIEDSKGQQAATYHAQVVAAARKYMSDRHGALQGLTAGGAIHPISVQTLRDERYLPPGFALANVYGQSACVLVRQRPPTAAGVVPLDALVVSTNGDKIEDRHLAFVASQAGQGSGYIREGTPGTAQGSTWSLDTTEYRETACAGGRALDGSTDDAGHLASRIFHDGHLAADFLYRKEVEGRPGLNTLHTPLRLAGKAVVNEGDSCGDGQAAIAVDEENDLLKCDKTTKQWRFATTWKNPVDSYAVLEKTPGNVGDVRIVRNMDPGSPSNTWQRAFVFNGSGWTALSVDEKGNLTVPGTVTSLEDGFVGRYLEAEEYITSPSIYLWEETYEVGAQCHIPTINKAGKLVHINHIGTLILDSQRRLMVCDGVEGAAFFKYVNNAYAP